MVSRLNIDHVVILVDDLDAAAGDYRALGFTVTPGGEHATGLSHNALIAFEDGSYIELIAFKQRPAEVAGVWGRFVRGEGVTGLVDFALVPEDIAAVVDEAQARGLSLDGPTPGGRMRPDGQQVRWLTAVPDAPDLPFLCADVTARELRVPEARTHANGVTGVSRLTVAVRQLPHSLERYGALLGVDAPPLSPGQVRAVDLPVGDATITLTAPPDDRSPLHGHLAACGEGPFSLLLRTAARERVGMLDSSLSHGARIALALA
jgi:hypothetical protein